MACDNNHEARVMLDQEFFMNESDIFELYSNAGLEKTILIFKGLLTQDILVVLAEMLKNNLAASPRQQTTKRMFSVFVELAQNINRYSAERHAIDGKEIGAGIVLVNEYQTEYTIISGNVIHNNKIAELKHQCEWINKFDPDGLKKIRREKLKQKRVDGKKGAGVGLIDIARKSKLPLQFRTKPIDANNSFISFFVKLPKEL